MTARNSEELARLLAEVAPDWCVYSELDVGLFPSLFAGTPGQSEFGPLEPLTGADLTLASLAPTLAARVLELEADNARMRKIISGCDWYWPADDTSSDCCCDSPHMVAEGIGEGEVIAYSRGGVVETRYYAFLDPADDSDSDDEFEADAETREEVEAIIAKELERRAALNPTEEGEG